nr:MAG TPA: hypothetical protein [Caudoviricetes sp.]
MTFILTLTRQSIFRGSFLLAGQGLGLLRIVRSCA